MIRIIFYILCGSFLLTSCGSKNTEEQQITNPERYSKDLEKANNLYTQSEEVQIDDYIARNQWEMTKTGSGLRSMIYKAGQGRKVADKTIVRYHYKVNLINGTLCDESAKSGPKEIWIGHADVVSGLEEGLLLLREGDKAKFIIPSHLAYGWIGDSKTIPSRAVLIYDVEILQVRDYNAE
ncbi:MAG: hypothetical protein A2W93_16090 [Bacteroidetes bacterium GWF2_43_63]|nr:MAG: hypothetical protein A2W94_11085 [Bacteroidetes bacterium GWE2_42_42]OFY54245.1 MAG: hypothetical protein A2W93_16090 [Bacteroidetes bacterium GWF2_43_63]HBG69361.1 peptidylprolyl isomerase [Bacteroidales bacterium]HCB60414.1 peptidylprolyl isomerase [Bacteroidales bacterium]HCY23599.1 peptidylprolyl isomerase [Bacteroidales bacterium]